MASTIDKSMAIPPLKTQKLLFVTELCLRFFAGVALLASALVMLINKQTIEIFGIVLDARYSYSPAFKFFAFANLVAFVFSVLSMFLAFILGSKAVDPTYYFYMFLHDLIITVLLMAGSAAATTVGYIGKYGNSHTGWIAICDHFTKFCNRNVAAVVVSYLAIFLYISLTIISANKSRQIKV